MAAASEADVARSQRATDATATTDTRRKKCRVCSDFKKWSQVQTTTREERTRECPAEREELGRCTWLFLHTMAAYYPDQPSPQEQREMSQFVTSLSRFYPCDDCAEHLAKRLKEHPPDTSSRARLSRWMCETHNDVNKLLGKNQFDCSRVDERWLDGWKDGSCD